MSEAEKEARESWLEKRFRMVKEKVHMTGMKPAFRSLYCCSVAAASAVIAVYVLPEKDIVVEFIKNEEFKYVRALGAYYMRLTGSSVDCYKYLEPLFNDNRKLRRQNRNAQFELVYMDEFIDELLREERLCDVILPRIQKRHVLEENNELEAKVSALDDDMDDEVQSDDEIKDVQDKKENHRMNKSDKERIREKDKDRRNRSRERDRERRTDRKDEKDRRRERSRSREREKERERRHREKERERHHRPERHDDRRREHRRY